MEVMREPVMLMDGHSYERSCIEQWLATGHDSSPKTNEHLSDTSFRPNHALRGAIAEWHEKCERTAATS